MKFKRFWHSLVWRLKRFLGRDPSPTTRGKIQHTITFDSDSDAKYEPGDTVQVRFYNHGKHVQVARSVNGVVVEPYSDNLDFEVTE